MGSWAVHLNLKREVQEGADLDLGDSDLSIPRHLTADPFCSKGITKKIPMINAD